MPSGFTSNPNVVSNAGAGSQYGYGSPMQQWMEQQQWGSAGQPFNWQQAGFDPNNPFGQTMYNQYGQSMAITPQMMNNFQYQQGLAGQNAQQWLTQDQQHFLAANGWLSPGNVQSIWAGGQQMLSRGPNGEIIYNPGAFGGSGGAVTGSS